MEKKLAFGEKAADAGKAAEKFIGKAKDKVVGAIDQNNDGKFDFKDVSMVAGALGSSAKKAALSAKDIAEEKARETELKLLRPIFLETLEEADFSMSRLIHLTEADKKHADSMVCQNSIGYISQKDLPVVHIYRGQVAQYNLSFYPDTEYDFYYADPMDSDLYIALDEYFSYMKTARINELQRVAQDLGAKHFRVTYKEEKKKFSKKHANAAAKGNVKGKDAADMSVQASHDYEADNYLHDDIAAEMTCAGHEPVEPKLKYLAKEPCINALIDSRMHENNPSNHLKYTLQLSNSTGMKEKDAAKIDAVLQSMKCAGDTTVSSEVRYEARRFLEYEIDF